MDSLDLGVLSVVASFGRTAALARLAVALGKDRGAELMSSAATVDELVMRGRRAVVLLPAVAHKPRLSEDPRHAEARQRERPCLVPVDGTGTTSPASTE